MGRGEAVRAEVTRSMRSAHACAAVVVAGLLAVVAPAADGATTGGELLFDVQPVTLEGRTLVPLRPIFEWLGAKVTYDGGHIKAFRSETSTVPQVELWVGSTRARVAEAPYDLDVGPRLIHGRAFVPLRFVAESFGVWVEAEGRQMKLSVPQEEIEAVMAIPPHPQAHLGKMWRVIERWYDVLPKEEIEEPRGAYPHWQLFSEGKREELVTEVGPDARSIVEQHWGGHEIEGIRILDGRVSPGAETGWAVVKAGHADGTTQVDRFDFVRAPTGWKVHEVTEVES